MRFHLTQTQLGLIGSGAIVGGNIGTHVGMLYDRHGPRAVLLLSAALAVCGWVPMWFALQQTDWVPPYALLVIFAVFQGHAQLSSDTAVGLPFSPPPPTHTHVHSSPCTPPLAAPSRMAHPARAMPRS